MVTAEETPEPSPAPVASEGTVARISDHPRYKVDTSPVIDWSVIRQLIQYGTGDEFVLEIYRAFVADTEDLLQSMEAPVDERDVAGFRNRVHALRSSSGNMGAAVISRLCAEVLGTSHADLEQNSRFYLARIRDAFDDFRHEFPRNAASLRRLMTH